MMRSNLIPDIRYWREVRVHNIDNEDHEKRMKLEQVQWKYVGEIGIIGAAESY